MTQARTGLVILVSGRGSNMRVILEAARTGVIPATVRAVISNNPAAEALRIAEGNGIATQAVPHGNYATREEFDSALAQIIDSYNPQLVVLAGFMRILTTGFIRRYEGRMINMHPSLLPEFPGLNTHRRAIEAGAKHHGATVHFVTPDVDAGPIIAQATVPVFENDTPNVLAERVLREEH